MARRRGEPTLRRLVAGVALPARSKAECAPDLRLSAASDAGAIVLLRIPQADPLRNDVDHGRAGHGIEASTCRLRFALRDNGGGDRTVSLGTAAG